MKKRGKDSFLVRAFSKPASDTFRRVNDFLATITLLSILSLVLETVDALSAYDLVFRSIEYGTVFFFVLEYIGRIIVAKPRRSYVFSFFGIIDLLAIIPTILGLANLTFLKSARVLRLLRFLRMTRLAKIARMRKKKHIDPEDYATLYKLNIRIYFFALIAVTVILGTLIYLIEGQYQYFTNIPQGMLWAAEIVLGGIPIEKPATQLGQILTVIARFIGLALFGLLINVMGTGLKKLLFGSKKL